MLDIEVEILWMLNKIRILKIEVEDAAALAGLDVAQKELNGILECITLYERPE